MSKKAAQERLKKAAYKVDDLRDELQDIETSILQTTGRYDDCSIKRPTCKGEAAQLENTARWRVDDLVDEAKHTRDVQAYQLMQRRMNAAPGAWLYSGHWARLVRPRHFPGLKKR